MVRPKIKASSPQTEKQLLTRPPARITLHSVKPLRVASGPWDRDVYLNRKNGVTSSFPTTQVVKDT